MKLKKKVKRLFLFLIIIGVAVGGFFIYQEYFSGKAIGDAKVLSEIKGYGYKLKDNKPAKYKEMFYELKKILEKDKVNEEKYVKKISEMFIYDFYSLKDKTSKTDIGGVDFIYNDILENFLENAQDTYYKYVENNIYKNRKQKLPMVNKIKIESIDKEEFKYNDKKDNEAYKVKVTWNYNSNKFSSYQKEAELVFIHDGKKLSLVELQ